MEYFKRITLKDLTNIITSTQRSLYLCLPSIYQEIAVAINDLHKTIQAIGIEEDINIIIDFDANTIWQGYGEFESINGLIKDGFSICTFNDNRISFVISDDTGYYLFVESRSQIPADKVTINAVKIDPVSIVRLKQYFFPGAKKDNIEDELANAIIEESKKLNNPDKLLLDNSADVNTG